MICGGPFSAVFRWTIRLMTLCVRFIAQRLRQIGILKHIAAKAGTGPAPCRATHPVPSGCRPCCRACDLRPEPAASRRCGGTGPLYLLIDSTGVKSESEGEWNARKHPSHRNRVSTAGQWVGSNGASGAGYTLEVTRKHWKRGLSRSPAATSEMLPCCRNFRTKSLPIRSSAVSRQTGV